MLTAERLRCEYLKNPLGIDETTPRLSWIVSANRNAYNVRQTAYQLRVATDPELLAAEQADLWDSGCIASAESLHIVYAGAALRSRQLCYWQVRLWDTQDQAGEWSAVARWSMGLLRDQDWQAAWVGADLPPAAPLDFEGLRWFWGEPEPQANSPREWLFRHSFTLPAARRVQRVRMLLTVHDQFKFYVNGVKAAESNWQSDAWDLPQVVTLTLLLQEGVNHLALWAEHQGNAPAGIAGRLIIEFADGEAVSDAIDERWLCSATATPGWREPQFDASTWKPAEPTRTACYHPGAGMDLAAYAHPQIPCLRREFQAPYDLLRATLYATALGLYAFRLNGERIGDDYFAPGWTDYRQRVCYRAYDVTAQIREGANVISASLAPGWYAGCLAWKHIAIYGKDKRLKAQLELEFADGRREIIATDEAWCCIEGPIAEADMMHGEHHDATAEHTGWDLPGYDAAAWYPVKIQHAADSEIALPARLLAYPAEPVRITGELTPRSLTEPRTGIYIFDLGQNMVGRARLRLRGPRGGRVIIRHGEMLNADGTLYTTNLRRARAVDVYRLRGDGLETWEPEFVFHGFRYLELSGDLEVPTLESVTGVVLGTDLRRLAQFDCSEPMLNQLFSNIEWGQRGNYLDVPTDCPQRDERLGWTGDAQVFIRTASYLVEIGAFFKKWLIDLEEGQRDDGAYPDVAPHVPGPGFGTPAWSDAGVICPYVVWQACGDTRVIERQWNSMRRFMDFLLANSTDLIRPDIGYGDWLSIEAETPRPLIGTAYFAWDCTLMAEMARAIGRTAEAAEYIALGQRIKLAFHSEFVAEDGRLAGGTQTAYLLALQFDLLPADLRETAARHLVADISARGDLLSVGFVGINLLCPGLSAMGRNPLAYQLAMETRFPSWGYEIKHGATTIWERWNSFNGEQGFGDLQMNSFNHYAFGSIGEWLFETVCGIRPAAPGFAQIVIQPQPGGSLTHARLRYDSIRGPIESAWTLDETDQFELKVEIPANTQAMILIPLCIAGSLVAERVNPSPHNPSLLPAGAGMFRVGSGQYIFRARLIPLHVPAAQRPLVISC